MDSPENPPSDMADACVAAIQSQMRRLSEELAEGQEIEATVPLANGKQILVTSFGSHNSDMVKLSGVDADGNDVCVLVHKHSLQVVLRRVNQSSAKPQPSFQVPQTEESQEMTFDETA